MALTLTEHEQAMLAGEQGPAVALSMRIITELGRIRGATELVDIDSVHIDGCIFYGQAGLDFAQRLVALRVRCACRRPSMSAPWTSFTRH